MRLVFGANFLLMIKLFLFELLFFRRLIFEEGLFFRVNCKRVLLNSFFFVNYFRKERVVDERKKDKFNMWGFCL